MVFENDRLRIGPTGVDPERFFVTTTTGRTRKGTRKEIPAYLAQLGLSAYEFSAGRMASFSDSPEYREFRKNVLTYDIRMSIHAPYYISLMSPNPETVARSIERLAQVYAWAVWVGAHRIVLHPGSARKTPLAQVQSLLVERIQRGIQRASDLYPTLTREFAQICLCLETMGKTGQLGTVEEICDLCQALGESIARPCIDFAHIYARSRGLLSDRKLYDDVFARIERRLGSHIVQHLHIHYSRISYTSKGEKAHVPNMDRDWGPDFSPLLRCIQEAGYTPILINESPLLEPDASLLVDAWRNLTTPQA